MSKMGKVPQPLDAPTKASLPKQDHSAMEGKMLPPKKPTDMPWPRNTPKVKRIQRVKGETDEERP